MGLDVDVGPDEGGAAVAGLEVGVLVAGLLLLPLLAVVGVHLGRLGLPGVHVLGRAGLLEHEVVSAVAELRQLHLVGGGGEGSLHAAAAAALQLALRADGGDVHGAVGHRAVGAVAVEGEAGELPVGGDVPLGGGVEELDAVVLAAGALEAPLDGGGVDAEVVLERGGLGVPRRPERAVVVGELCDLVQPPLTLVELLVVGLLVVRYADEPAVGVVRPAVEGAGEDEGVAVVVAADLHAAVAAGVEEGVDDVLPVARDDDLFLAHAGDDEVAGVGDLALVAEEEPRAGEYLLQLLLVDRLVDVDLAGDEPLVEVDQAAKRAVAA